MIERRNYSIKRKLTWMNMLVSGAALLVASAAFAAYEVAAFRLTMVRSLSIQAQMVGSSSASALLFGDPDSANKTLSALRAAPNILFGGIYTPAGELFAAYWRDRTRPALALPPTGDAHIETHWFTDREVVLVHSIVFQGKRIGKVCIRSDLRELKDRLTLYAGIVAIVLLISLITALVLSSPFQRTIARPIVQLAQIAGTVSHEKNYSVRAPTNHNLREIAILIEAFNEMLAQIQRRDAALQQAHERLNLALKSSGVGTWSQGIAENTIAWDDYMSPLFGLKPGVFSGNYEDFLNLVHPEDRKRLLSTANDSIASNDSFDAEFRVIWRDGSIHALSARGKVHRDQTGRPMQMIGVCWDISERKRAEEERQRLLKSEQEARRTAELTSVALRRANSDLEQFTYLAYHDLREPLRMVKIYTQKLKKEYSGKLGPGADLCIRYTVQGATRMEQLVRDLLTYTHAAGESPEPAPPLSAEIPLASAISSLQPTLAESGASISYERLPEVKMHRVHLEQLFHNLAANAIKYRGEKPPEIKIRAQRAQTEWVFSVQDNGIGIDRQYREQIFGVFKRLHSAEEYSGTGIGLAICRKIVQRYGGRIWVESELRKGATFLFTVPDGEAGTARE
jgi:PAS domain S-box-containing protein